MKMEQTECSETSAYKIQTPGNYPKENIQHTEHGESLKSRVICLVEYLIYFLNFNEKYSIITHIIWQKVLIFKLEHPINLPIILACSLA